MRFKYEGVEAWPPLSWLAQCEVGGGAVRILHGSGVETTDDWFCEAAWAGDYETGAFDRTDIVAGTGGRLRQDRVLFVSSGSMVDRLHSLESGRHVWVSNSLPALLAAVGGTVDPAYPRYSGLFGSVVTGLAKYHRHLPTTAGPLMLTYFDNLAWDGRALGPEAKPGVGRDFGSFARYRAFLDGSLRSIAENAAAGSRRIRYELLGTLSSGYDSTAVSTLGRSVGLRRVLGFDRAFSALHPDEATDEDRGDATAQALELEVQHVQRDAWQGDGLPEVPFIAADAFGEEVHYKAAEPHLARKLLLTGYHGDKVWAKHVKDLSPNIVRGDLSGLALSEYRLWVGFINCPVAFWGVRQIRDINAISHSPEMKPWDVPRPYSRPICRRIAEEAGVPRDAFGIRKRATSVWPLFRRDFLTPSSREDYRRWLRKNRSAWIRRGRIPLTSQRIDRLVTRGVVRFERLVERAAWSIGTRTGWHALPHNRHVRRLATLTHSDASPDPWVPFFRRYAFPWALEHAKARYGTTLQVAVMGAGPRGR